LNKMKKLIVIGNSPTIFLENLGSQINQFDTVVRINKCKTENYKEKIGEKISIWACTKPENNDYFLPKEYDKINEIWFRTKKSINDFKKSNEYFGLSSSEVIKDKKVVILYDKNKTRPRDNASYFRSVTNSLKTKGVEIELKSLKEMSYEPCTGLLTILKAIEYFSDTHDIYLLGFTFGLESPEKEFYEYYRIDEVNEVKDMTTKNAKNDISLNYFNISDSLIKLNFIKQLAKNKKIKFLSKKEKELIETIPEFEDEYMKKINNFMIKPNIETRKFEL